MTIGSQWEKGEALRSQIEVMKTEFTARLNEFKENNDQKNFKNTNLIEKVQKEAINENTYTRKIIDEISNRLTPKVNELEQLMKDQLEGAINKAVTERLEHTDIKFIEDIIKRQVDADKISDKFTIVIEEKFQIITGAYEKKIRDTRSELIGPSSPRTRRTRTTPTKRSLSCCQR